MKNKFKKFLLINLFAILIILTNSSYAATASISATKTTAYVGDSVSINVTVNAAAWNLSVSGSGITGGNITGFNMEGTNQSTIKTYTLNTKSSGTYTIYLKGDISDGATDVTSDISKSITVTVKTKPVTTTTTKPSNNTTTTKPTTNTNKNTTTSKNTTPTTLSSNAYLSQFRINEPGITPAFSKTIYNYSVAVGSTVNSLNVTALPEDSRATVSISGNTNLKEGDNTITVRVTAQDKKTVKTYKIIVTKTDDPVKSNAYLKSLFVANLTLNPEFSSEVFEYNLGTISNSVDKLDITAFPENENSKVDIIGNDNLVIGENIIKIVVTSENTKMQKTYTLKVIKEQREESNLKDVSSGNNKNKLEKSNRVNDILSVIGEILKENATILLLYLFIWIEFLQVVYLYEKVKKLEGEINFKNDNIKDKK